MPISPISPVHADTVARIVDRFGHIDCLVNNAGMGAVAAWRCARSAAGEFRPGDGCQSARYGLPDAGRRQRRCWPARWRSAALDRQRDLGQRCDGVAGAARLLHLQGRARHVEQGAGAAPGARRHRRVRRPPGHHPHRHDRRGRRTNTTADRRWPGSGPALGRARGHRPGGGCACPRRLRLRHGQRDRRRWRAVIPRL